MKPYIWVLLTGGAAAVAVVGCATMPGAQTSQTRDLASGQCLMRPLSDTRVLDAHTLLLVDVSGRGALAHMSTDCLEPDEPVIMKYFGGGNICGPLDADISSGGASMMPQHCIVDHMTPLGKDEARQMLNGGRPRGK